SLCAADPAGPVGDLRPDGGQAGLMRILLVGASGFIGRHLLTALAQAGHAVVATSRQDTGPAIPGVEGRRLALGEPLTNPDSFIWPDAIDLLINAAGQLSTDTDALYRLQSTATCALFDLARRHGVRVLQISALGAGEQPDIPFLASKAEADR